MNRLQMRLFLQANYLFRRPYRITKMAHGDPYEKGTEIVFASPSVQWNALLIRSRGHGGEFFMLYVGPVGPDGDEWYSVDSVVRLLRAGYPKKFAAGALAFGRVDEATLWWLGWHHRRVHDAFCDENLAKTRKALRGARLDSTFRRVNPRMP